MMRASKEFSRLWRGLNLQLGMLLPGITINTSPTKFAPITQMQMARFDGESWELFGPVLTGEAGGI
jgi:branched-chain amino acid transport system substrate-binding protein